MAQVVGGGLVRGGLFVVEMVGAEDERRTLLAVDHTRHVPSIYAYMKLRKHSVRTSNHKIATMQLELEGFLHFRSHFLCLIRHQVLASSSDV
jgi:hypothetical protein